MNYDFWCLKFGGRNLVFAPGGRNVLVPGERPAGRLASVTYLMATAIYFDQLISEGAIEDFAEIARLENASRSWVKQILNLRLLAPDIQEALLRLPRTTSGHDRFNFREIQSIALESDWKVQRRKWRQLVLEKQH
ncbi:MAG: hypothetical protein SGI77_23050 [Pirellulaceae bacterium]|nr:hypothetical protein [Pirellulaceae bacterium]